MDAAFKQLLGMVRPLPNSKLHRMKVAALKYCAEMANLPMKTGRVIHFTHRNYASSVVVEFAKYPRSAYMTAERIEIVCKRFKCAYDMRLRGKDWRFYGRIDEQRYVIIQVPKRGGLRITLFNFNQVIPYVPSSS